MPKPCSKCTPYDGSWMEAPGGLTRCDCALGRELQAADGARTAPGPAPQRLVVSAASASAASNALGVMPYYPSGDIERTMIGAEIRSMCRTEADALWLVRRMIRLYDRWPGAAEMRRVYCASRRPLDGMAEIGASDVYPEGMPAEHAQPEPRQLLAPMCPKAARERPL